MAENLNPYMGNLDGATEPFIASLKVQAGSTAAIKMGEICSKDETSGYMTPVDAIADNKWKLAVAAEEQKASGSGNHAIRYMKFYIPRPGDKFEFELSAAAQVAAGDALILVASESQQLTRDVDGVPVAFVVGSSNVPDIGTSLEKISKVVCVFKEDSSVYSVIVQPDVLKVQEISASVTLIADQSGQLFTNGVAAGDVTYTLPTGSKIGTYFDFFCTTGASLIIQPPAASALYFAGSKQTDTSLAQTATIGAAMKVVQIADNDWATATGSDAWILD